MSAPFTHEALSQTQHMPLVYTAMSKHLFYYRLHISKYVLEQNKVPLNPFMIFDYFLLDTVDRNLVRAGNNNIIKKADEVWVFGPISNGVLAEILLAKKEGTPLRWFAIQHSKNIVEVKEEEMEWEEEVRNYKFT